MSWHVRQIISPLLLFLTLTRCAQIAPLTGGARDTKPPEITGSMPANRSVNFAGNRVEITFNEFIQLKDLSNQLIVSPLVKTTPEISASGKKLLITFERAELQPNTTYRVFLGNAVADMNESNSIPQFEYVFSTGEKIDTLSLKGVVTDAISGKPAASSIVTLYRAGRRGDSLIHKELPDYLTRTNTQGEFVFRHLPPETFRVFSIEDKNKNNLLDGGAERTAFLSEPISLLSDSSVKLLQFEEEVRKGFIKATPTPFHGLTHIVLNRKALVEVVPLNERDRPNIFEERTGLEKDTVTLHYRYISDSLKIVVRNRTFGRTDTLRIALPPRVKNPRRLRPAATNVVNGKLPLHDTLKLRFSSWMDTSRMSLDAVTILSQDSGARSQRAAGRWINVVTLMIENEFKPNVTYILKADTGAFSDVYGISSDSMKLTFTRENELDFGKVTLKMYFNRKQTYLIQLLNDQQKTIRQQSVSFALSSSNAASLVFADVLPGTYHLRVISDDNNNSKWDTGDVIRQKQPERVYHHVKPLKILADWEIEEEIRVSD